jgi:hypothetical protein
MPVQLVLDLKFLSLQCRDVQIVVTGVVLLIFDLAIEFAVTPNKRLHMAFSRHSNSSPAVRDERLIVTNFSHAVDLAFRQHPLFGAKLDAKLRVLG